MTSPSGCNRRRFSLCIRSERCIWSKCHQSKNHVIIGSSRSKRRTLCSGCHPHLVLDHLSVQSHETVPKSSASYIIRVVIVESDISASGCASGGHSKTCSENQIVGIRSGKSARRSCRYRSIPRIQKLETPPHCLSSKSPWSLH